MNSIFIQVTQYQAGQETLRTIDANTMVQMVPITIRAGLRGTSVERVGHRSLPVLESLEQIKILVRQATSYS